MAPKGGLRGRAFYESIGSPKIVLAPMVDQSEFAWRLLTRSYIDPSIDGTLLAYSPMFHARLFSQTTGYRQQFFQPTKEALDYPVSVHSPYDRSEQYLDGNPGFDRPLFVQFCANDPAALLGAASYVQPYCDAVDLNLGCPQGIAKKGHYGAFLQEQPELIHKLIRTLSTSLEIPVTAKIRILETPEATLNYAKGILEAGASILTVHGRLREQKGHNTGVADWAVIRYLREHLPPDTVLFANGNILIHDDIEQCLRATGADAVMSAEGNLFDPTIFASRPMEPTAEFWADEDGKGGYRVDGVIRRYLGIIYQYILEQPMPTRSPLFVPSDNSSANAEAVSQITKRVDESRTRAAQAQDGQRKRKRNEDMRKSASLAAMKSHFFSLLRHVFAVHTDIRDALVSARLSDMDGYEYVLQLVEAATAKAMIAHASTDSAPVAPLDNSVSAMSNEKDRLSTSENIAIEKCRKPWWICQPFIRPLPHEAFARGSLQLSKKEIARQRRQSSGAETTAKRGDGPQALATDFENQKLASAEQDIAKSALVCG